MDLLTRSALALLMLAASAAPALAQGTERATNMKISSDKPIQIESQRLEVRESENVAIFTGDVSVIQGQTQLKAGRMTVRYKKGSGSATAGSADIDRLEVEGKVYVRSDTQVATADKGVYDMGQQLLVLSGKRVVLSEGDNVIVGCKLTVHTESGLATLESCKEEGGRVKMLLNPGSAKR